MGDYYVTFARKGDPGDGPKGLKRMSLEEARNLVSFARTAHFTGRIINAETGEELETPSS